MYKRLKQLCIHVIYLNVADFVCVYVCVCVFARAFRHVHSDCLIKCILLLYNKNTKWMQIQCTFGR